MDTQNPSVHPHAQTRTTGKNHPHRNAHTGGVIHDNSRHTTRFTVIGNHLAQHPELSGLAIGLAVHIQSLPTGARADIKTLADRFPDEARADLALATLSAVTHAKNPDVSGIPKALSTALQDVPEAVADPIIEFTAQGLSGNRRATQLWRNLMAVDLSFYKSWLSEEIRDEGRAQRGAEDILLVLEARGLDVPDEDPRTHRRLRRPGPPPPMAHPSRHRAIRRRDLH